MVMMCVWGNKMKKKENIMKFGDDACLEQKMNLIFFLSPDNETHSAYG